MATPLTEEQKSKYEEAAKEYAKKEYGSTWITVFEQKDFLAGTEHAHPIGFNLGKEEGKKEGWNEALDALDKLFSPVFEIEDRVEAENALKEAFIELQKLRK